ncbi:MAG: hypothetical protein COS85_08360 [Armatimonadetes bacterium CG07_land_8_20_14_0_80_59_28]|nr:MAG: hypothetical protein COS85_08360 [Armatimonadetes bacterium CG07_land_8_20_14_0_80_59_28]PIX40981.1 MAG: hypothetical protein COZ56_13220 [Armatimonadetes bacterium CG_4_8_14_3_um_filter_58_9]PIY44280.1 MAG: hypothetical protein COZ05_08605 [Armatimonadetes bacterium CG_4_10_14_3_um_filter_59_10]
MVGIPGYITFTAGYWMHANIWLDVDEVREWAKKPAIPYEKDWGCKRQVPREYWPATLRRLCRGYGTVIFDPTVRAVKLADGGGFGHWGVYIGPWDDFNPDRAYRLRLRKDAWVWHEI